MIKAIKRLITITYFPIVGWMIYLFFFSDKEVSPEVMIGFIIYVFVILNWWAGDSVESYDWEDDDNSPTRDYMPSNLYYGLSDDN